MMVDIYRHIHIHIHIHILIDGTTKIKKEK